MVRSDKKTVHTDEPTSLKLPVSLVGSSNVSRLLRELEAAKEFMTQAGIRSPDVPLKLPKISGVLQDLVSHNNLDLSKKGDMQAVVGFLSHLQATAPLMNISFAVDPSAKVIEKVIIWLRREIHPHTLLQMGLQPSIGAGFILRTPNRSIDCSLSSSFNKHKGSLIEAINNKLVQSKTEVQV
jgi:hypothetical protein